MADRFGQVFIDLTEKGRNYIWNYIHQYSYHEPEQIVRDPQYPLRYRIMALLLVKELTDDSYPREGEDVLASLRRDFPDFNRNITAIAGTLKTMLDNYLITMTKDRDWAEDRGLIGSYTYPEEGDLEGIGNDPHPDHPDYEGEDARLDDYRDRLQRRRYGR